jgi:hypothetical protein
MTKKHYEAIAKVLADQPSSLNKKLICLNLAAFFSKDNPLFNRSKFLNACGIRNYRLITFKPVNRL